MGNTRSETPYAGVVPKLNPVVKQINADNPVFLMHMGGMIRGGSEWDGISRMDIDRQYKENFSVLSGLKPIFYTVNDKSGLYKNSPEIYLEYAGRKEYYSFNYGNLHFLVLDSSSGNMSGRQEEWIINDLMKAKDSHSIFVFIHNPLFVPLKHKDLDPEVFGDYRKLHGYFLKYNVKAVFSGCGSVHFQHYIDGILYINAGCGGFNRNDPLKGACQYYIVDYNTGAFSIQPKYAN